MIRPTNHSTEESSSDGQIATADGSKQGEINIRRVLAWRTDLSTFVVHLTRDENGQSAKERLELIINSWKIEARNPFGSARKELEDKSQSTDSQKCVCFTETPLEYVHLLTGKIEGRRYEFQPYGVAITKTQARKNEANPVWYVDITQGHDWLMNPVNELINQAIDSGDFDDFSIAKISPFIEQMGDNRRTGGNLKEFWWEREWRHAGDFTLPDRVILICPESEHENFEGMDKEGNVAAIDADWGLEEIIAYLAGFERRDVDIFQT